MKRLISCTSSFVILNLSVLSGMPSALAVAVVFQPFDLERANQVVARERVYRPVEHVAARRRRLRGARVDEEVVGQILVGDPILLRHRHQALDQVLELADVARPPVRATGS